MENNEVQQVPKFKSNKDKPQKLKDIMALNKKLKKENLIILKTSIQASKNLFDFDNTYDLYNELINIEPTKENYLSFTEFLNLYKKSLENNAHDTQENKLKIDLILINDTLKTLGNKVKNLQNNE